MLIHLGLDSTDSPSGGCTTYTASKIIDALVEGDPNIDFIGFPKLIRLNPNIPIKTRGNAAIAFSINTSLKPDEVFDIAKQIVIADKETNVGEPDKKPGLVLKIGKLNQSDIYSHGLQEVLILDEIPISELVDLHYPENANGLIGALCAMYSDLSEDHTFELIAYRKENSLGTIRKINLEKLVFANNEFNTTFSSIDLKTKRELIAPSGPDPVFCGIRSNDTNELVPFLNSLEIEEELDSWTIFKSNQATNSHMNNTISEIFPFNVFSGELFILKKPEEFQGGHIKLVTRTGDLSIDCMAFEPTKELRDIARLLIPGDRIYAHGNVKQNKFGISISLEFFMVLHLADIVIRSPPKCNCGVTTKSAGKFKGYKCPSCKTLTMIPKISIMPRSNKLFLNQRVYAALSAQRHLTKPKSRLHQINNTTVDNPLSYNDIRNKL
ncbi:MAG: DUF1743 domain-containing protein [Candidatus Heimdallarchaeota archaeon]|nr:DUF1743 domain-containing protein [Candidatus Heimdallarchaeota archaeon]